MPGKEKNAFQLERHFKGVANHYRIEILRLVARERDLCVDDISALVAGNNKTISEHVRKLVLAGLLDKRRVGRAVCLRLSPYGQTFYRFIIKF